MAAILVLLLIAACLFLWKGGHHALVLYHAMEEFWDADHADQSLTLQFQSGGFRVESGEFKPQVTQQSLSADAFWTECGDERVLGLTVGGFTAYLRDDVLYMDSGSAYTLPDFSKPLNELAAGLLLYGRVTREGDTYRVSMEQDTLELSISVTADPKVRAISVTALLPDKTIHAVITPKAAQPHPLPQPVLDSMVRAEMVPPMSIREPLDTALTAMSELFPLSADLSLGMDCGILELSESVVLRMDGEKAELERGGAIVTISLPDGISNIPSEALGLLLLHSGEYAQFEDTTQFTIRLIPETTADLIAQLVPQAASLGIEYQESEAILTIQNGKLTTVTMTAGGSVPFLVTTIPLAFSAELNIH